MPSMTSLISKVRLATTVGADVDCRLRMLTVVQRTHLSDTLTKVLDDALPPFDELVARLSQMGAKSP